MEWYTKYLSIFGLTLSEIPGDTLSEIGTLLHEKQSDTPLVSVVVIAHNEEPHILAASGLLATTNTVTPSRF